MKRCLCNNAPNYRCYPRPPAISPGNLCSLLQYPTPVHLPSYSPPPRCSYSRCAHLSLLSLVCQCYYPLNSRLLASGRSIFKTCKKKGRREVTRRLPPQKRINYKCHRRSPAIRSSSLCLRLRWYYPIRLHSLFHSLTSRTSSSCAHPFLLSLGRQCQC
jgi:hypothetical protein